jgi:hypothetical protein
MLTRFTQNTETTGSEFQDIPLPDMPFNFLSRSIKRVCRFLAAKRGRQV